MLAPSSRVTLVGVFFPARTPRKPPHCLLSAAPIHKRRCARVPGFATMNIGLACAGGMGRTHAPTTGRKSFATQGPAPSRDCEHGALGRGRKIEIDRERERERERERDPMQVTLLLTMLWCCGRRLGHNNVTTVPPQIGDLMGLSNLYASLRPKRLVAASILPIRTFQTQR